MSCLPLDRVSPTRRPDARPNGHQTWEKLLFVHFTYPAELVRALVPKELELDLWDDRAWVGLVPFEMKNIRPAFVPKPLALDFLETNLRTYVHRNGEPGVYFFSLEASSLLAVEAARFGWGLPYFHADMETTSGDGAPGSQVRYETVRRGVSPTVRDVFEYTVGERLGTSEPGTLEHFLLERYLLFTVEKGRVSKGHVHHVPYPAHRATLTHFEDGLLGAAGLPAPSGAPAAVHYSPGVEVDVFGPWEEEAAPAEKTR
jgi:hypothetical protein